MFFIGNTTNTIVSTFQSFEIDEIMPLGRGSIFLINRNAARTKLCQIPSQVVAALLFDVIARGTLQFSVTDFACLVRLAELVACAAMFFAKAFCLTDMSENDTD